MALFSVSVLIPRTLPEAWVVINITWVTILTVTYVLVIPITAAFQSRPFLVSWCHVAVGLFDGYVIELLGSEFRNACRYLLRCCFSICHELMDGPKEAFREGNLILFFLVTGLEIGSLFSLLWSTLS